MLYPMGNRVNIIWTQKSQTLKGNTTKIGEKPKLTIYKENLEGKLDLVELEVLPIIRNGQRSIIEISQTKGIGYTLLSYFEWTCSEGIKLC